MHVSSFSALSLSFSCLHSSRYRVIHVSAPATNARLVLHCDAEDLPPASHSQQSSDEPDAGDNDSDDSEDNEDNEE